MRLVDKSPRYKTVRQRECYAGQEIKWLGECYDWEDKRLAQVLTGPIEGSCIWVFADEIAVDADGEGAAA